MICEKCLQEFKDFFTGMVQGADLSKFCPSSEQFLWLHCHCIDPLTAGLGFEPYKDPER